MNKKGRLSSTLLMIVILLPLMGLLIMDNEMKTYNIGSPTGMFIKEVSTQGLPIAMGVMVGLIMAVFVLFEIRSYMGKKKTRTITDINSDINSLQKSLAELEK